MSVSTEITSISLVVSDELKRITLADAKDALEYQALTGVDRDGSAFPKSAKSKKGFIDLHARRPSPLWNDVDFSLEDDSIVFKVDYAFMLEKYKADALTDAHQLDLESALTNTFNDLIEQTE